MAHSASGFRRSASVAQASFRYFLNIDACHGPPLEKVSRRGENCRGIEEGKRSYLSGGSKEGGGGRFSTK